MYCKNCGSILPNNANFCHVCGTKVGLSDIFDAKKEEPEDPMNSSVYEEPKHEERIYRSYYDEFNMLHKEDEHMHESSSVNPRKAFIPGMIGMIGSIVIGMHSLLTYTIGMLQYNQAYKSGAISYPVYLEYAASIYNTTGIYLVLGALFGVILGVIGALVGQKAKSKRALVFSILSISFGGILMLISIFVFIIFNKIS
jgi:hypothetical protein